MAKKKVGLPEGYDLRVTANELLGEPANLPGYLDDAPKYITPKTSLEKEVQREEKVIRPSNFNRPSNENPRYENPRYEYQEPEPFQEREIKKAAKPPRPRGERLNRMQFNITPDIERKVEELLDLLGRQSPDGRVTLSELIQSLVINAYDARDSIDGRLPQRGKWGTASAKSYSTELSIVIREAILKEGRGAGISTFKRSVG